MPLLIAFVAGIGLVTQRGTVPILGAVGIVAGSALAYGRDDSREWVSSLG